MAGQGAAGRGRFNYIIIPSRPGLKFEYPGPGAVHGSGTGGQAETLMRQDAATLQQKYTFYFS